MHTKQTGALCVSIALFWSLDSRANLPTNFPPIEVTTYVSNQVAEGYIFLASWSVLAGGHSFLMILNNDGTPVDGDKYKELAPAAGDFKLQPNGLLSYAETISPFFNYTEGWNVKHQVVDESLTNVMETIQMRNGYLAEFHDFQLLPNGHALLLGYYLSEVDLSQIVSGGNPAAQISGAVIQELDAQRNAVFQWRSWDHYNFADHTYPMPGNDQISDFHINTLNLDPDGNLIAGTPTEIRKINRQTGEVMWTLGGAENEFTIVGAGFDASDFGGHGTHRLPNGNFLVYDNSDNVRTSRAIEYSLDETNKIASVVWYYAPETVIKGLASGYAQRLPNGNTFICWGIPRTADVPICTEVTPAGDKVFELTFTNTTIQSYRAFRFPYPSASQQISFLHADLAPGNIYLFTNTGVAIEVTSGAEGYNDVTVTRESYAPVNPLFQTKAPRVLPCRVKLTENLITSMGAKIYFDATKFGFADPANLTVYHRSQAGQGLFLPQTTDYNQTTHQLRATMNLTDQAGEFGEFIFAYPDVADVAYPPLLAEVENYRGLQDYEIIAPKLGSGEMVYPVNQELPILLSWSPEGFARWFEFQIATDPEFSVPIVDVPYQTDAFVVWNDASPNMTYYYRARTVSEGGSSDWSSGAFQTVAPMIAVTSPSSGEAWQPGLSYYIQWQDNIAEDVVIDLYQDGTYLRTIATNSSTYAYSWEVDSDLLAGNDYSIRISSVSNPALFDTSELFGIGAPQITSIQPLSDGAWVLQWTGPSTGVYIEHSPTIAPASWSNVDGPISGNSWTNTSPGGVVGFYRLRVE